MLRSLLSAPVVIVLLALLVVARLVPAAPVTTSPEFVTAVRDGAEGATVEIGPGTYELDAPLEPNAGMTLKGAGMDETIITGAASWKPSTETLPDPEMRTEGMDTRAYLIRLQDKAADITVSDLTLRGPHLHGALFGFATRTCISITCASKTCGGRASGPLR